ncbi:hypothetical protein [Enterococcus faecalis]|nr:hypothetical protein [Enterococcus faecalis]
MNKFVNLYKKLNAVGRVLLPLVLLGVSNWLLSLLFHTLFYLLSILYYAG